MRQTPGIPIGARRPATHPNPQRMNPIPRIDLDAKLHFVINAASGSADADAKRGAIEAALRSAGRTGELLFPAPGELASVTRRAAASARAAGSAVVAVGGDGTINAVAQAAHAEGCPMGVLPQGTFNYFARANAIPPDPVLAADVLMRSAPRPVQIGLLNDKVFLVNASVGLYPQLLEDREAYKARFGRSRGVALVSGLATLLREHRQLRLRVERGGAVRNVRTPTLFVGNNRLQLEQVGVATAAAVEDGSVCAVLLKPIGTAAMLWLLLRGAMGSLGEADDVESFAFQRMAVNPSLAYGRRRVKVAVDGEVSWMRWPLEFSVAPTPLYLLAPLPLPGASGDSEIAA
jgi:diacylglycerol kinase family enzyme